MDRVSFWRHIEQWGDPGEDSPLDRAASGLARLSLNGLRSWLIMKGHATFESLLPNAPPTPPITDSIFALTERHPAIGEKFPCVAIFETPEDLDGSVQALAWRVAPSTSAAPCASSRSSCSDSVWRCAQAQNVVAGMVPHQSPASCCAQVTPGAQPPHQNRTHVPRRVGFGHRRPSSLGRPLRRAAAPR